MNLNRIFLLLVLLLHSIHLHAADPLTETFQKGLFEEEANRDLAAAVKAYEDVVRQLDSQRKLAATAVFRLGECYRKLGRTNDAVAQFQRIVREYSDDETLAKLSLQNLVGLGVREPTATPSNGAEYMAKAAREILLLERQIEELKQVPLERLESVISMIFPDPILDRLNQDYAVQKQALASLSQNKGSEHPDVRERQAVVDTIRKQIEERIGGTIRAQELKLQALKASQSAGRPAANPPNGDIPAQRAALEREIELAQQQLKIAQTQVSAGRATAEETIKAEREVLRLQRELAALQEPNSGPVPMSTTVDGGGSARAVAAQVSWLKGLKQEDRLLAIQTQVPSDRMKELMQAMGMARDREARLDRNDSAVVQAMLKEGERLDMEIVREADAILRSLELKAEMLRAAEAAALGKAVRETAGAPDVRPLRITVSGAAGAPLILVYPNEFPAARIPAEHLTNPTVVIGTTVLAEVVARANVIGVHGKTNAIAIRRTEGGEEKKWRLDPAGKDAQGFELQDGDVIEVDRKMFVF